MKCWNCLTLNKERSHRCSRCDQPLQPNGAQRLSSGKSLNYLLSEVDSWDFLAEKERIKLSRVYHNRLNRLEQAGSSEISHWPESDWDPGALPEPEAGTTRLKEQTSPPVPQEPQPARTLEPEPTPLPPQPATPGYLD